jgi:hypothetical protein
MLPVQLLFRNILKQKRDLVTTNTLIFFWKERCGSSSEVDTCSLSLQKKQHCRMTLTIREGEACGLARQKQTHIFPCVVLRAVKSNGPVSELG